jgi:hypothetical protein
MLLAGIITDEESEGKPFTEPTRLAVDSAIEERDHSGSARLSLALILRFAIASARADYRLRNSRISRILRRVTRINGRLRRKAQGRGETSFDSDRASTLIAAFRRLRPFYPRRYLCLFDSLALLEFLAGYRLATHLVFGVIAEPFEAHCWLQQGTTVLNDDLERVARYTAIFTT